jgi:hypothetical protein
MCWYGLYRVMKFHPVLQAKYRQWLELSPWTNRLPLPLGPVMFVWQDAVLIAAVTALGSMRYATAPLAPFTAFATTYAVAACVPLLQLKRVAECVAIVVLLPLMIPYTHATNVRFDIAGACFLIAQFGMWRTLAKFRWPRETTKPSSGWLGFPMNMLGPIDSMNRVPVGAGLGMALIIGWWVAVIGLAVPELSESRSAATVHDICWIWAVLCALVRMLIYCATYLPPTSLWGAIRTGRLIIPRYHYILISPALVAASGWVVPGALAALAVPAPILLAISLTVTLALALELGPTFDHWRLTGAYRMHSKAQRQQRRPGQLCEAA